MQDRPWWSRFARIDIIVSLGKEAWAPLAAVYALGGAVVMGLATFLDTRLGSAVAVAVGFFFIAYPALLVIRRERAAVRVGIAERPVLLDGPQQEPASADAGMAGTEAIKRRDLVLLRMLDHLALSTSITTATAVLAAISAEAVGHHATEDPTERRGAYEAAVKLALNKLRDMRGFDRLANVAQIAMNEAEAEFKRIPASDFKDIHPAELRLYRIAITQWERMEMFIHSRREELIWELASQVGSLSDAVRDLSKRDAF